MWSHFFAFAFALFAKMFQVEEIFEVSQAFSAYGGFFLLFLSFFSLCVLEGHCNVQIFFFLTLSMFL